jgi:hypothetical protein
MRKGEVALDSHNFSKICPVPAKMALPHFDTPLKIREEKIKAASKKAQKSLTEVVSRLRNS